MALSYSESICSKCMQLAKDAQAKGDTRTFLKYANPGTYRKVSEVNDRFSYKKATVGTLVFGTVGAVAGINGKKTVTYQCDKCGHTFTKTE